MEGGGNDKGLLMEHAKKSPPPFLMKTYMMVEDPATDDVISWNADGTAFVVWQTAEFARDLLPTLFKHSNFSSFVRQLNTYGFRKVATSRWEFCNELFRKGEKELLSEIRRRKALSNKQQQEVNNAPIIQATPQESGEDQRSSSNTSSSSDYTSLVDENKRLKKENGVLSSELTVMKMKHKELRDLIAKYVQYPKKEDKQDDDDDDDQSPMLFGVRLEVQGERNTKRHKRAEIGETATILLSQS